MLLGRNVALRHDFGFGRRDADARLRIAVGRAAPGVTPGVPWHVSGSLLGLDIALAPLALRRLNFERVLEAPKLTSNEREAFAVSVSLLDPFALRDADRDAIADAIAGSADGAARSARQASPAAAPNRLEAIADADRSKGGGGGRSAGCSTHEADRVPEHVFARPSCSMLGGGAPVRRLSTPGACRW